MKFKTATAPAGQLENLPALYLAHYRSLFHDAVARDEARYFVLPYTVAASFLVPAVYLCIPHRKRPWLYRAQWAVAALMVAMSVDILTNGTSSANMPMSYCSGLVATWGLIWGLTVILVLEPQTGAARVMKRRRRKVGSKGEQKEEGDGGQVTEKEKSRDGDWVDESVAMVQDEYEHYWQFYPEDGSLVERLGWVLDIMFALRGVGWNFAIPSVPHPPPPSPTSPKESQPVNLSAMPIITRTGYHRSLTYRSFALNRLFHIIGTWLLMDYGTLIARPDPYFTLGQEYLPDQLPSHLSTLPTPVLNLLRSVQGFLAVLCGLSFYMNFYQLVSCIVFGRWLGIAPSELWQYPSGFGSFVSVLDNGLAGFWGGWWHQTFRIGFTAPVTWLTKNGYLDSWSAQKRTVLSMFSAFLLSGTIHAAGGYLSIPSTTNIWSMLLFFQLNFVGVLLQSTFCQLFKPQINTTERWVRRTGNGAFVLLWSYFTQRLFVEDLCHAGLFLFEPVPVSPLRWIGVASQLKGDGNWWRWDEEYYAKWVWGKGGRWWESGIRL
ncbi:hypothetical protein B0H66DRAFT_467583 [Apodospora peruviana]|uniref:Wax synthase domain-containing protein n=1 Tax=Apodospora peruviana TaxID=516989 RepID=A0AAE0IPW9_9PEZI|nr:hypothetical protein B0H66DRAFT_467583 [Apodospora peruviana]